ncbi:MAG: BamA/TamA family outer membrane protein [Bacteroidales bacterium]|nr:BamA/TamA family outer membrane protein [Bacteroidales bacterium]
MKGLRCIFIMAITVMSIVSCSTTRVLQDDQFRLAKNKIKIENDRKFNPNLLQPYLKQKPNSYFIFGWNPFLNVYNWQNGKGKGWDRLVKKIGVAPVIYDAEQVENSILNLENHLNYLGYYDSHVESNILVKRRKVNVTYNVTLGKRYPIKEITYTLPQRGEFTTDFLKDTASMSVKVGDYLSESALEAETERSSVEMRNRGFYNFNKNYYFFEADTLTCPDSAILHLTINEYTRNESPKEAEPIRRFFFRDVSISYPKTVNIKEKVLRNLNTIVPGDPYSSTLVNTTYNRLSALRIFSSVNIGMTQVDTNLVDCSISLSQSKVQGFKVNLEGSTNSSGLFGVSPQLSYYHKNIFRGGEWLNLSFMGNFQFKFNDDIRSNEFGVGAGLSFPRFFPLPYKYFKGSVPRTDINISYNYQDRPEYTRNIISTSYGYTGSLKGKFFYQAYPIQMNIVHLVNLDPNFYNTLANDPFLRNAYQDHFDLGSGLSLYYTTNAESVPKESFFYSRMQFDIAGNLLSAFNPLMKQDANGARVIWNTPYSQYVRGELTLGKTWIFGRKGGQALATRLLAGAGYAYGNSSALPFEKHFYGGGSNSLRGWQARTVGPGLSPRDTSFVIPNQTGDMKLEANIEYRFNMFWKVAGAVFVDAGNIWTLKDDGTENGRKSMLTGDTFGKSIAANWGVGLRLDFSFLILRLDLGLKVHDPAREQRWVGPDQWFKRDGYALHFGVGYPF